MRKYFFVITCLLVIKITAQNRVGITGKVIDSIAGVENTYVHNVSSGNFTITNVKGTFTIEGKVADTIRFLHNGYKEYIKIVTTTNVKDSLWVVELTPFIEELKEVVLEQETVTTESVGLGTMDEKYENMTRSERKLDANKKMGNAKYIFTQKGISLPIAPMISALFGNKKLKKKIVQEKAQKDIDLLYTKFYAFSKTELNIPEDYIMLFMFYLVDNNKQEQLLSADQNTAEFYLTDYYVAYKNLIKK